MRLRLASTDEVQFLTCFENGLWGSNKKTFKKWNQGDLLAIIVDKKLAALSEVISQPFESNLMFWDNGLFPHRVSINFTNVIKQENRPPISGKIKSVLEELWGSYYGWGILNKQLIESPQADIIITAITSCPNDVSDYRRNLSKYLKQAKTIRKEALDFRETNRYLE